MDKRRVGRFVVEYAFTAIDMLIGAMLYRWWIRKGVLGETMGFPQTQGPEDGL